MYVKKEQVRKRAIGCRSINNGVVNVMSFTNNKRNSSLSTRITHQSNNVCINTHTPILSFFPVVLMRSLYSSSIWLQMFFIRYDYKDGSIIREREREREKMESKKERNLHRRCHRGCHITIITITITLPEGFIYHQLQLIRLLLRLATVDLYLDIYSFIHLFIMVCVPCFICTF
jgi:hypothetical protein